MKRKRIRAFDSRTGRALVATIWGAPMSPQEIQRLRIVVGAMNIVDGWSGGCAERSS